MSKVLEISVALRHEHLALTMDKAPISGERRNVVTCSILYNYSRVLHHILTILKRRTSKWFWRQERKYIWGLVQLTWNQRQNWSTTSILQELFSNPAEIQSTNSAFLWGQKDDESLLNTILAFVIVTWYLSSPHGNPLLIHLFVLNSVYLDFLSG